MGDNQESEESVLSEDAKIARMKASGMIREAGTRGRAAREMRDKGTWAPPVTGYLNCVSARPGETITCYASAENEGIVSADIIRIVSADPNPDGPGLQYEEKDFNLDPEAESFQGYRQEVDRGSYGVIARDKLFTGRNSLLLTVLVQPWLLGPLDSNVDDEKEPFREKQVIASALDESGFGWSLFVKTLDGSVVFEYRTSIKDSSQQTCVSVQVQNAMKSHKWHYCCAGYDINKKKIVVSVEDVKSGERVSNETQLPESVNTLPLEGTPLVFAAEKNETLSKLHFNGRLEDAMLYSDLALMTFKESCSNEETAQNKNNLLAFWDFSLAMNTQTIIDIGPCGLSGRLVNVPCRAMRGSQWTGDHMDWQKAPREYACIHFHEDDLYDCKWQKSLEFTVPPGTQSGCYGLRLRKDGAEDILPFYILAPKDQPTNNVCFLAPTLTYLAYANHARGNCNDALRERMNLWGASQYNADDFPQFSRSTYNYHPDGTGISFSSRLRPTLTVRPAYLTFCDPAGSGLRHFSADSHLMYWLESKGIGYDVITDDDLDDEGIDLLQGYDVLLTGSHPEYHTRKMLDSLQSYVDNGGKMLYLGGNGFYWKVAREPRTLPGIIELRRAEGGIRAWSPFPGEYYHQLDGGYGGLWRRNGRPPQQLACVGFSSQGLFESSYYRRTAASHNKAVSWIFNGVTEEFLGDYGLSGGGAAGFELDRADFQLGTPEGSVILAVSENHSDSFIPVPEEMLSRWHTVTGEEAGSLVRAEIVYCDKPGGGKIFAVGSICFCGSLNHNGGENGVSKMLENVLRRFAETV